ncbi:Protein N-lysine methyltransferase METTL20 [Acipenser ruthenus]|uniref:Electron transfer flavoprotein beta subunit lysine methyltransferase n=1 Tax=Acipenser ruthenus TaxID=7906 RepID=A0A444U4S1_ACIRT|nr:electron transfer flavoprotein beta subunit lysine methyltransferase isoform X1 [Acipenser ruthenus]RXM30164.1 Protein N-lysine methyltransferase METTL20 [Acipenser ruthenus]
MDKMFVIRCKTYLSCVSHFPIGNTGKLKRILSPIGYRCKSTLSSEDNIKKFIIENTEVVGDHITPEIRLRLFTPNCRFWYARPELWPFSDPYWAIYWPGGQALARYLLDNPGVTKDKKVLDLGSGCGASSIAARLSGASQVLANDIDPVATIATTLNCELNGTKPFPVVSKNLIGTKPENWELILLGDMFYEEQLADRLHSWLRECIRTHHTQVLIGDPGRAHFEGHTIRKHLQKLADYQLPDSVREQNYGLTTSTVWRYQPLA